MKSIVVPIICLFLVRHGNSQLMYLSDKTTEKEFINNWVKTVSQMQSKYPMVVDKNTTLDSVSFSKTEKVMNFYNTMTHMDMSIQGRNAFHDIETKKTIDENLMKGKTAPYMKKFGVRFFYYYFDMKGLLITKIEGDFK